MSLNQHILETLLEGPATVKQLARGGKAVSPEEMEAHLEKLRLRLWVTRDDSGQHTKYEITDVGRRTHTARYNRGNTSAVRTDDTGVPTPATIGETSFDPQPA